MATSYQEAVEKTIIASEQLNQIVNGTATAEVVVEDGSKIPSVRKALVDNFYFKDPLLWQQGQSETVFNQLRKFSDGTLWYAPTATTSNVVTMGVTPIGDPLWAVYSLDAIPKLTPQIREALRRSYAEAGYTLVSGSFESGGVLTKTLDAMVEESSGKVYSGPVGVVPPLTNPVTNGFVEVSLSGFTKKINITSFMTPQQVLDCSTGNPLLDYTNTINTAFSFSSVYKYQIVIDQATTIKITSQINTVEYLDLYFDGTIKCAVNDISAIFVAGTYFRMAGKGTFDGMGNNIRRFIRTPFVDGQSGKTFKVCGVGGRLQFKNVSSTTFHRSIDIFDEGIDFEIDRVLTDSTAATPNGIIGDLNGSCRAVYVGGSTTGVNKSFGSISDVISKNLLPFEDGDAIHVQSNSSEPFSINISKINVYNVAKRAVKVQMNGVCVNNVIARAESNIQSMYAVVSMYGNGQVSNVFGTGKIMNGVDAFNTNGRTTISNVNIQSTQQENEQQACVNLAGGYVDVDGVFGYGCFYSVFARSIFSSSDYKVSSVYHDAKDYNIRVLQDPSNSFNCFYVENYVLTSNSATRPSIITSGTIGKVYVGSGIANASGFVGASFGHSGLLFINGISLPNCVSHGVEVLPTVSGGELRDVSVVGSAAAHAAIVKCGGMLISDLRGGAYSTLRFDGISATGNKADGLVIGAGSTRPYEEINGASSNVVTGMTPFMGSVIYNPPSLPTGNRVTVDVPVLGARFGDHVVVSVGSNTLGVDINAWVVANDLVRVSFQNNTTGTVDIAESLLKVFSHRT